jgi:TonB family protein
MELPLHRGLSGKATYVLAALVIIGATGSILSPYLQPKPQVKASYSGPRFVISSPLSLWASRSGKNVTISWDSRRPAIAEARVGVLTIKENDATKEISLTSDQLQGNKLVHAARSDSLQISLEVFSEIGRPTLESIMISTPGGESQRSRSISEVAVHRMEEMSPAQAYNDGPVRRSPRPVRTFRVPPSGVPPQARSVVLPDLPPPERIRVADTITLRSPEFLQPSLSQSQNATVLSGQRAATRNLRASVQPPAPLRQVTPVAPSNILGFLRSPVTVRVRVSIDRNGKVASAVPVVPRGGINEYLAASAASAARMWAFQPARRGDTLLASETVLNFTFNPKR